MSRTLQRMRAKNRRTTGLLIALGLLLVGCAPMASAPLPEPERETVPVPLTPARNDNLSRLQDLWNARIGQSEDFVLGPGDVIEISAPGIDELKDRTVRVDGSGQISLPLIGEVDVRGLSEEGLRKELCSRLAKFMYRPQVEIFFKSYSSRQVAVTGSVHAPGMYVLNGPHDTLRDVLERAGGITDSAAAEVILTPLEAHAAPAQAFSAPRADSDATATDRIVPASLSLPSAHATLPGQGAPVVIDLEESSEQRRFMDLPMRPGDTVYVPQAGHVTVIGWVYYPKVMEITPGLTVLGAVAAAGGPLYAADMTAVKLIRQGSQGTAVVIKVDLNRVKRREDRDVPVQANDVVEVGYSTLRLPGYAVYYAAGSIFTWMPAAAIMTGIP